ncbi:MAG: YraN family protein [Ignavibacteria bacterium]|nr:YraN family protein [Ignavibacteria bacterium]
MNKSSELGKSGEDIACQYLLENGFQIVKRNFHFGKLGEIDIIAEKDNQLVFVEVKVQSSEAFGDPRFWINHSKQKKLRKTAEGFLFVNKINSKPCRFDAIIVDFRSQPPLVHHIENAF